MINSTHTIRQARSFRGTLMAVPDPEIVGIVGYGRFGQLWARLLDPHYQVVVTDVVPKPHPGFLSLPELCAAARTIFLSVPINQFASMVAEIAPLVRPCTTVIDTCSVKVHPAEVMTQQLSDP